ncbi:LysE family translocator [Corynebacterium sp. CCM 8862]|uniref:LysE family translocator n=2 Tax=Corynebacterium mendelii TaxID=2765362 RepID=A0A939E0X3_9CORY|nr:LysE family translocator [Corynebacterium mendelii]MBN9644415.1 LysE family translocator [Corynebacterium mendelii]
MAAIASPGPDIVQIIRTGAASRTAGIWCAVGICTGNLIWITASLAGLSAAVRTFPGIVTALQIVGGLFLGWLGIAAVAAWRRASAPPGGAGAAPPPPRHRWAAWRLGVATNLSNPKALLFFGAIFARFIHPDDTIATAVVITVVLVAVEVVWFVGVAVAVEKMAATIRARAQLIDAVAGVVFLAVAAVMLGEAAGALMF